MVLGQLNTSKPIENAIKEIRTWLDKINVNGITIDTKYDARTNVALLRFNYMGKNYEFKSTKQSNCRLNMHAIARVIESKVRNHIMGIEEFNKSMIAYIQIGASAEANQKGAYEQPVEIMHNPLAYATLGVSELLSNEQLQSAYKSLMKAWHPDMANSEEAKLFFEKKCSEINSAWNDIKKERGM